MEWRRSRRGLRKVVTPLFPRHVFVRCYLEIYAHLELISIPGVLRIMEDAQGRWLVLPEDEIHLLRRLCDSDSSRERTSYQPEGELVEVVEGHLRGLFGVIREQVKTTLLVPIHTLQVSVAVDVERTQLKPRIDLGKDCTPASLR
jgi:transcription antitermination factor NusG